jgi:hypothetical protein
MRLKVLTPATDDRRVRRLVVALAALLAVPLGAPPAIAQETEIYPLVFPVTGGPYYYSDTWGAPRPGGRTHEGTDILTFGVKGLPVLAAADGTVGWMHAEQGGRCCAMEIVHDDGWRSWYIHLNNDTQNPDGSYSDDGQGWGFADGIAPGAHVTAGQVIGYVGDSGNAENTAPHLHFELHRPDRVKVNPYPHLVAAELAAAAAFDPPFRDDDGSVHEENIGFLYDRGITNGCAPERYCPSDPVTRGQMAAFLSRALGLTATGTNPFSDVTGGVFVNDITAIYEAGITLGCADSLYCPKDPVTRAQMASFIDRAFALPETDQTGRFDDATGVHAGAIDRLAAAGITTGCTETSFCPHDPVTRAQMASFIARAIRWHEG